MTSYPATFDRQPACFLMGCALVTAVACVSATNRAEREPVIASWQGGHIVRADYDSWRSFRELEDSAAAMREIALVESFAEISRRRGAESEPRTRLALEAVRQELLMAALHDGVVARVEVTGTEIDSALEENPDAFVRPRKLKLLNVYKTLGSRPQERREQMQDLHRRLVAGADFVELARTQSESQSRYRDGSLGYLDPEQLPSPVAASVRDLRPGEISGVIEHGEGLSIFRCEEVREAIRPSDEEIRNRVRNSLTRYREKMRWRELRESLLTPAAPKIDPVSRETVLEMDGYVLDAESWAALLVLRAGDEAAAAMSLAQQSEMLRTWALGVAGVQRAVGLGLHREPQTAAALRWKQLDVLAQAELVRRVDARLTEPDEADLRRRYDANARRYYEQESYLLGLIQISDDEITSREAVELANEVVRRLEAGELSFEEAARRFSEHPSAEGGGTTGWLPRRKVATLGPIAVRALQQLEPGERTDLLHLESGLFLLELRGRREARWLSFDEARPTLSRELRQQQIGELEALVRQEQLEWLEAQGLTIAASD
jgi:parvulin-like peptidyl-prolyl isomerase